MQSITKIPTLGMSHEEWLAKRRETIGGSDAGTLLGLNQYSSPYSLWCEKTGKIIPEDISDKEAVRLGNDLEQYVAERFTEATNKKVRRDNSIIYNSDYPFAHANIDRAVVGENAGLECKTTSSWDILKQCQNGDYPDTWYAQMTHYMMITGAERWYLGVLVFGRGFFHFCIERNQAEIDALAAAEEEFWSNVTNDTPPPVDGSEATVEALKTIYSDSTAGTLVDLTAVSLHLASFIAAKEHIKEFEAIANAEQAQIMKFMADAEKGSFRNISVSYKTQQRKTFDKKAYEAVYGKIPDQFFKVSSSRPFKVNVQKG